MTQSQASIYAGKITTIVSVIVNSILCVLKTWIGIITGSTALVADGIHSIADLVSDFFTYAMLRIAHEEPDEDHPYGHGKFETFGTFALAVMLAITALWIGYEAVHNLIEGNVTTLSQWALWAAAASILANEFLYHFCKYWGNKVKSKIILANAWHHRTDSLSSVAALIGIGANMLGFVWADAIAALVVTLFLLRIAYRLGVNAFHELVEAAVEPELQEEIMETINNAKGTTGCHRLRARRLGAKVLVDVHVEVPNNISVTEGHAISENVEKDLLSKFEDIDDITVHVDPQQGLNEPMPHDMEREHIHPRIENAVKTAMPAADLHHIVLHITEEIRSVDVIITGDVRDIEVDALQDLLLDEEEFPFHHVNIYHKL